MYDQSSKTQCLLTGPGDFEPRTNYLVTIPADEMEITVEVVVTDDDVVEDVESFSAALSVPVGETLVAVGTNFQALAQIIDNDRKFTWYYIIRKSKALKHTLPTFHIEQKLQSSWRTGHTLYLRMRSLWKSVL